MFFLFQNLCFYNYGTYSKTRKIVKRYESNTKIVLWQSRQHDVAINCPQSVAVRHPWRPDEEPDAHDRCVKQASSSFCDMSNCQFQVQKDAKITDDTAWLNATE